MEAVRPVRLIDPVCGMTVDVASAEAAGLLLEHEGRTYAFCRAGCRRAFIEESALYVAKAEAAEAASAAVPSTASRAAQGNETAGTTDADASGRGLPAIDEGMRRWYESCSCCLGDAYPEIKAQLDAERAATALPPVDPGICEVADGVTSS